MSVQDKKTNMADPEEDPRDAGSGSESENEYLLHFPSSSTSSSGSRTYSPCRRLAFLLALTFFSALGGFLFGYDTGVVSGAMLKIREDFNLAPVYQELIVSMTIAGAAMAALLAGPLSDLLGRKPILLLASFVFTIGAVVMSAAPSPAVLLVGRFVVGVGVGFAAMAVPMFISESAPAEMRGKLVVVNIAFVTGGQFIATLIDGAFSYLPLHLGWRLMLGLAGVPSLVMFCGLLFMPETPRWLVFHDKIPRARKSLCHLREPKEAEQELQDIIKDYQEYKAQKLAWWQVVVKLFTTRSVRLALVVGCGLQMFQQFGGINTVMYYSASIIQMAGFPDRDAIWLAAIPAFGNFIFTILGLILVDRIGRRKLILGSSAGVILSLALLGAAFYAVDVDSPEATPRQRDHCDLTSCGACVGNSQCGFCVDHVDDGSFVNGTCTPAEEINGEMMSKYRTVNRTCLLYFETTPTDMRNSTSTLFDSEFDTEFDTWPGSNSSSSDRERRWFFTSCPNSKLASLTIVVLFIYIAFFAPGMGPLPWTINAEIYPTWARSTAIAIATTVNWLCNLIVSMTFLTLTDSIGQPATFWMYAGLGILGLLFMALLVPETKGRKLEEVQQLFQRPWFTNWCS